MSEISEQELSYLLESDELGEKAYFLTITSSWLNLRILDILFREGEATAGELAREINTNMADVNDSLQELENVDITSSRKDETRNATYWYPIASKIDMRISDNSGLDIKYSVDRENRKNSNQTTSKSRNNSNMSDNSTSYPGLDHYLEFIKSSLKNIRERYNN